MILTSELGIIFVFTNSTTQNHSSLIKNQLTRFQYVINKYKNIVVHSCKVRRKKGHSGHVGEKSWLQVLKIVEKRRPLYK